MSKIVVLQQLTESQKQKVQEAAPSYEIVAVPVREASDSILAEAEIILGWSRKLQDFILSDKCPVQWIQTWSAGVDKMPMEQLEQKQVLLTSANGVHTIPISEQIFAYMLAFSRNLHRAVRNQGKHAWDESGTFTELHGKTIVIVGVGNIGAGTAQLAKAFGMKTIGVRRSGKEQDGIDQMYSMEQLDEALAQGDYVINILPLTEETKQLFNRERFAVMKDSSLFINVGRGPSVDTDALVEALQSGAIAGAGLDVFDPEPLPEDHPLWDMEQVIITPHIAGSNEHYTDRVIEIFTKNLQAYQQDRTLPVNLVDYSRQY
ncbi:D-2-hydroxyacid dehydrogenase [Paenibacillus bovis]|uniref:Hydroxyacid dehydrogenase n=1 Tax=Paenibacillus bovis TaxID=1616788 RepID=A0A172ZF39_9BACL|nr:D-2-hydroxyacid dehydrogenase [Paenibacillus bovis]ANF95992.1 hydroxyacid dehydrogenase [Paenibacillus bovis]